MKRIGILTFHRSINYGAFMQSYSLAQNLIKRYGEIVEIIDFEKASKHSAYHSRQNLFRLLVYGNDREIMKRRFEEDLRLLPLSDKTLITDDYDEVRRFIEGRYSIVIVGSDAVWAYNRGLGLRNPYWLYGSDLECEKFSYAASAFSLDQTKVSEQDRLYIASCLKSYSYIGVRDQETEKLVKDCLPNAEVFRNCDPTVLLDKPNQNTTVSVFNALKLNPKKKLVTIMMGIFDPIVYKIMNKLGNKDFQYVYLYSRMKAKERFIPSTPRYLYDLSPFEWYNLFGKSYLNITTFFHGTLLALKSNVPTIAFDTNLISDNYKSKIEQVMTDMNLLEFYNSYLNGVSHERVYDEMYTILNNHKDIEELIDDNMKIEAKKADSFFERLDRSVFA